jgi:hypothetical protein
VDDIDRHLRAYGPLIMHRDGSARGEVTHRRIQLNRKELCSRRIDAIKALQNLIDRYTNEAVPALKSLLRDEIFACAAADQEYSFCLRQYISDAGIK